MDTRAYTEWPSSPDVASHVACLWRGHVGETGVPYTDRVLPDACVDIIWDGARLFVAGPDTGPVLLEGSARLTFVGIRARPGRAAAMLGVHADAILDQRVDLTEVWGRPRADELLDRVARAADTGGVANATDAGGVANATDTSGFWKPTETCGVAKLLEAAVRRRLAAAAPDLLVDALVARLSARRESAPRVLRTLAAELGATERSLHRRCTAAVGYGPKTLDRVLRFRRARRLAGRSGAVDLADLAVAAGYADQAHMTRECRRLSGLTPSEMFKTRRR